MSPEDLFQDVIDQDSAVAQLRNPLETLFMPICLWVQKALQMGRRKTFAAMIMNHTNPTTVKNGQ